MSLSEDGIRGMLEEYKGDHCTGMDTAEMAHRSRRIKSVIPLPKKAPHSRGALIHERGAWTYTYMRHRAH